MQGRFAGALRGFVVARLSVRCCSGYGSWSCGPKLADGEPEIGHWTGAGPLKHVRGVEVQNAKDTFYEVLRDRVAAGNAGRTVVIRGAIRPAVVVDENEMVTAAAWRDCFRLQWNALRLDADGLAAMEVEVAYATAGTSGGMDRGRALSAMDAELKAAVNASPQNAVKKNFAGLAGGGAATEMGWRIWWGDVVFGGLTVDGEELRRTAKVIVWSYEEAGEA